MDGRVRRRVPWPEILPNDVEDTRDLTVCFRPERGVSAWNAAAEPNDAKSCRSSHRTCRPFQGQVGDTGLTDLSARSTAGKYFKPIDGKVTRGVLNGFNSVRDFIRKREGQFCGFYCRFPYHVYLNHSTSVTLLLCSLLATIKRSDEYQIFLVLYKLIIDLIDLIDNFYTLECIIDR